MQSGGGTCSHWSAREAGRSIVGGEVARVGELGLGGVWRALEVIIVGVRWIGQALVLVARGRRRDGARTLAECGHQAACFVLVLDDREDACGATASRAYQHLDFKGAGAIRANAARPLDGAFEACEGLLSRDESGGRFGFPACPDARVSTAAT